jgi:hypothetical protein
LEKYGKYSQFIGETYNQQLLEACAEKFGITSKQVWDILMS